jgi:spore germination cell wall hydrolase CwlJ-like protein
MNPMVHWLRGQAEVEVLARNLFFEARGEPEEGIIAVGHVVLNRAADDRRWGETVTEVVCEPNQFSWTRTDDPQHKHIRAPWRLSPAKWSRCLDLARKILAGETEDPTAGANHYLNVAACRKSKWGVPSWYNPRRVTVKIGNHTFLKL